MNTGTPWRLMRPPRRAFITSCVCGFWGKPVMQEKEEVNASRGNCKRSVRSS